MKFNLKKFWKESVFAFFLKNIVLAVVIFVVMANIVLFAIDGYTRHGEAETVPDLRNMYVEEAEVVLASQGLSLQVIDSMYDRQKTLGAIVEQTPPAASTIKKGRSVYVIINSTTVRKVPVPDVRDVSLRQAEATLGIIDLKVGRIEYKPSEYKDLVLDMLLDGKSIPAGQRVPEGTAITLVVGQGSGTDAAFVPDLLGLPLAAARDKVREANLVLGAIDYDVQPAGNEADYVIISQQPVAGSWQIAGSRVDIWLSTDRNKITNSQQKVVDEDNFF